MVILFWKYSGFLMFRLMDEINFLEIACLHIVVFQSSPTTPSCDQSWHSRRDKSTLFEGTKMFRSLKGCKHVLHTHTWSHDDSFTDTIHKHTQLWHWAPDGFTHTKKNMKSFYTFSFSNSFQFTIVILTVTNMNLGSRLQNFTCVVVNIFWCFNVKMKLNGLIS